MIPGVADVDTRGWRIGDGARVDTSGWLVVVPDPCPSTDELLDEALRYVPPEYEHWTPILAGTAASVALAACSVRGLVHSATLGGARGPWLDLRSKGYGVSRGAGEPDGRLVARLRSPRLRITRPAIEEAVAQVMHLYASDASWAVVEHFEARVFCDVSPADGHPGLVCGLDRLYDAGKGFTVVVPDGLPPAAYTTLVVMLNQTRGSGVRCWLYIEGT